VEAAAAVRACLAANPDPEIATAALALRERIDGK